MRFAPLIPISVGAYILWTYGSYYFWTHDPYLQAWGDVLAKLIRAFWAQLVVGSVLTLLGLGAFLKVGR